jgi:hypothetical protein
MEIKPFAEIDLNDIFFDSLKGAYAEFEEWYIRKAVEGASAYVQYNSEKQVEGFLYLKIESGQLNEVNPPRGDKKRLKVGTFKVNPHGTKFGERFIKKIMDKAIVENVDEVYVTVFDEHTALMKLMERYGFRNDAIKETANGTEQVLFKDMRGLRDDIYLDYPLIQSKNKRKFALGIYPMYHTKLFPDSILNNENYSLIEDVSHTNSIHKVYISFMDLSILEPGDLIAMYRTTDNKGPAYYRSVITSVCVVEEIKSKNHFKDIDEFITYAKAHSVFDEKELRSWYNNKSQIFVIRMTYNIAFNRKVTNKQLQEELGISPHYWGFFPLSDAQFFQLLEKGEIYENIIIN